MIGLDKLIETKGVVAAGQFDEKGSVVRAVGDLSREKFEEIAKLCAEQAGGLETIGHKLSDVTGLDWKGLNGWVVWSGRYALCISGNTGVIVEASKADFNQLMVDLFGPPAGGVPVP